MSRLTLTHLVHYVIDAPQNGHTVLACAVCPETAIAPTLGHALLTMGGHWQKMLTEYEPNHTEIQ